MNKIIALIGGMALATGVQAADLSILDNVDAQMMNAEDMATTQGSYCCGQYNWASQLTAISQYVGNVNMGVGNFVGVSQVTYGGNDAIQINDSW